MQQGIELNKHTIENYHNLGIIYEKIGNRMEAIKWYDQALSVDSDYKPSYLRKFECASASYPVRPR